MKKRDKDIRTVIEFRNQDLTDLVHRRTVVLRNTIPNVTVGQRFCFDHPTLTECLSGKVANIQHAVFLGDEKPVTYIDVECE
jgi:hypothetical protein